MDVVTILVPSPPYYSIFWSSRVSLIIGREGFRPQWHHIFPSKYLEDHIDDRLVDALANIAVIGPSINIRISAKAPLDYVRRYQITPEKLEQQFIAPEFTNVPFAGYEAWARSRAQGLATEANKFFTDLRSGI